MPRELDHICTPLYAAYPTRPEEEIRVQDSRVTQQQQQQASPGGRRLAGRKAEDQRVSREKKIDGRWKSRRKLLAQQSRSCLPSFSFPPSPNSQLVEAMMEQGIKPRALGRAGGGARSWLAWPWTAFPRSDGDSVRPGRSQIKPGSDRHRHHIC